MKNKLLRIGLWILVWIVFNIAFILFIEDIPYNFNIIVGYIPYNPHAMLSILMSPITSLIELADKLSSPFELATRIFSEEFKFGIFFWIVVGILLYFPRNRIKSK